MCRRPHVNDACWRIVKYTPYRNNNNKLIIMQTLIGRWRCQHIKYIRYVGPPCCRAEKYAGRVACCTWWVTVSMSTGQPDVQTDGRQSVTLRFPHNVASIISRRAILLNHRFRHCYRVIINQCFNYFKWDAASRSLKASTIILLLILLMKSIFVTNCNVCYFNFILAL